MPSLTWCTSFCCLTTLKLRLWQNSTKFKICIWGFPELLFVVPASFKLPKIGSFHMLHLLPWLITFNIVGYINERELNNWCGVSSICNSLHIGLHLTCSVVCAYCHAMPHQTGHASYLFVHHDMFMLACLPCCLLLSGLPSVPFRSCEDSFDRVRLSSSWTRSSSLRDFRQDDCYPGSHYYHCYASCFVLLLCCATYHLFLKPPKFPWTSNLWLPS